jgi:hypothetical protein
MAYCGDASLPEALFDDGVPGEVLCPVATKATVIDIPRDTAEEVGHSFDAGQMRNGLPKTWH